MAAHGFAYEEDIEVPPREPILDTVDRVCELCFGLFMALTFVGGVSAATSGQPGEKMLYAALGCNLAWGLADAVMFLVRTLANRGRRLTLALAVKNTTNAADGVQLLRDALPTKLKPFIADMELERIRTRLVATKTLPAQPRLAWGDFLGAAAIFAVVVFTTFPVVLPFVLISDASAALLVSRGLTLAMLFAGGIALGRHAGASGWKEGAWLVALGVALTTAIIALGG